MSDKVMTRMDRQTYKMLQQLKLDLNLPTIGAVVTYLLKEYNNG